MNTICTECGWTGDEIEVLVDEDFGIEHCPECYSDALEFIYV